MSATELTVPPNWRCIDFISDVHLHAKAPHTFAAWNAHLINTSADAIFILGDLFEVWVGDDCLQPDSFEQQCVDVLKRITSRVPVYVMHGNRDFLLGTSFMSASGCTALQDPTVVALGDCWWLLTHGDALCLDDIEYQRFRKIVRGVEWQQGFLSNSLSERKAIAKSIRTQSEDRKNSSSDYCDADTAASVALLNSNAAQYMVHGHTHRPYTHTLPSGHTRIVLSDWDVEASPPRAEVLRLQLDSGNQWIPTRMLPLFID
jgi:UDP-2,3-diacylglucosamine hydrolase